MKKVLLFLLLLNFSFAQNFFKIGYGTNGYRLGLDFKSNANLFSYTSLIVENKYEDGNPTINGLNYSYVLNALYLNLGLMFSTKLKNFYITPFAKVRRTYFKIENSTYTNTTSDWSFGGGISFGYFAYITSGFAIVPQAYIYYMPQKTYYFKNEKITDIGKDGLQLGFALDLNIGFNCFNN